MSTVPSIVTPEWFYNLMIDAGLTRKHYQRIQVNSDTLNIAEDDLSTGGYTTAGAFAVAENAFERKALLGLLASEKKKYERVITADQPLLFHLFDQVKVKFNYVFIQTTEELDWEASVSRAVALADRRAIIVVADPHKLTKISDAKLNVEGRRLACVCNVVDANISYSVLATDFASYGDGVPPMTVDPRLFDQENLPDFASIIKTNAQGFIAFPLDRVDYANNTKRIKAAFDEYKRIKGAVKPVYDLVVRKRKIKFTPTEFNKLRLDHYQLDYFTINQDNLSAFAQRESRWVELQQRAEQQGLRMSPAISIAIQKLLAQVERLLAPMTEIEPIRRVGWLEGVKTITCTKDWVEHGFTKGEEYPISVTVETRSVMDYGRMVTTRKGNRESKDFLKLKPTIEFRIGRKYFTEAKNDIENIVEHFALPSSDPVHIKYPEEYKTNRAVIECLIPADLPEENNWNWYEFQIHQLACVITKEKGALISWEQGLGKTLGGIGYILAQKMLHPNKPMPALIVAPQDLCEQWVDEAKEKFNIDIEWLGQQNSPQLIAGDFVRCRDECKAGLGKIYITHFEALSRTAVRKASKNELPMDIKYKYKLETEQGHTENKWNPVTNSYEYIREPDTTRIVALDANSRCPECGATAWEGWHPEPSRRNGRTRAPYCNATVRTTSNAKHIRRCNYVHTEKKFKGFISLIKNSFRHGIVVIDEISLLAKDSDRSLAIRGLKAAHLLGLTGTPIKNYLPDAFWGMWLTARNDNPRFPFSYHDGRRQFEDKYTVVEYEVDPETQVRKARTVTPELACLPLLWRLTSSIIVRMTKDESGEKLQPRIFYPMTVPMGTNQLKQTRFWLQQFADFYAQENPTDPIVITGRHENMVAMLGQTAKLDWASVLPEGDPDRDYWKVPVSNWTPVLSKAMELACYHAARGEKVLIGSNQKPTARFLVDELNKRRVNGQRLRASTILKNGDEYSHDTLPPQQRAKILKEFQRGRTNILASTLKAINLGHNLDACNTVIIVGLDWSWEIFSQFVARVHRITSKRPVNVYVLMPEHSLQLRKWDLLLRKGKQASLALDGRLIEEQEAEVDQEAILREMRKRGIPAAADGSAIPEEGVQHHWSRITDAAQLPAPALPQGTNESGEITDEIETGDVDIIIPDGILDAPPIVAEAPEVKEKEEKFPTIVKPKPGREPSTIPSWMNSSSDSKSPDEPLVSTTTKQPTTNEVTDSQSDQQKSSAPSTSKPSTTPKTPPQPYSESKKSETSSDRKIDIPELSVSNLDDDREFEFPW